MKIYVERTDDGLLNQVDNFLLKAPNYPELGLVPVKLTDLRADWTLMKFVVGSSNMHSTHASALVAYKQTLRYGGNLGGIPPAPTLAVAPPVTSGGMEARFRDLIQDAVRSSAMTEAIAKDLGIVAPETAGKGSADASPSFKLTYSSGGYPLIIWKKGHFEGVEIHKSKDGINFTKLDRDYKPDFIDKSELPQPTKAEVWYYKLIYLVNETEHIGQCGGIDEPVYVIARVLARSNLPIDNAVTSLRGFLPEAISLNTSRLLLWARTQSRNDKYNPKL
jgi:hypothetical protein